MTFIPNVDFFIRVSRGLVPGHSITRVIARNPDVDITTEDIWFQGGTLTYLTSAELMRIKSTSTNDVGGTGTGVRTLLISGLDGSYNEISETVTMNGTTNVLTVNSYLRVHTMDVVTAGTNGSAVGNITATAQVALTVHANIPIGENKSAKSHFTIPAGKTGYLLDFLPSLAAGKTGADVAFQARPFGEVFSMISRMAVTITGTSAINHSMNYGAAKLLEKTDTKVVGTGQANDQDIFSECILMLIDN